MKLCLLATFDFQHGLISCVRNEADFFSEAVICCHFFLGTINGSADFSLVNRIPVVIFSRRTKKTSKIAGAKGIHTNDELF